MYYLYMSKIFIHLALIRHKTYTIFKRGMLIKRVLLYLMIFSSVTVSGVWAEQLTGIRLDEGVNQIAVSVVNRLDRDIAGLTIKTDQRMKSSVI